MRIRSRAHAARSRQHPIFLPSFSKSSVFLSKLFQTFLWWFCGISRGYKVSKPKCPLSKLFAFLHPLELPPRPAAAAQPSQRGSSRWTWKHRTTAFVLPKGKSLIAHQDRNCPFQQTRIENHKLWNYRTRPNLRFSVPAIVLLRVANWALKAIGHFAMIASSPSPARMAGLDPERSYDRAFAIK
jgi:hypothetical protein